MPGPGATRTTMVSLDAWYYEQYVVVVRGCWDLWSWRRSSFMIGYEGFWMTAMDQFCFGLLFGSPFCITS